MEKGTQNKLQNWLWNIAGFKKEVINECKVDQFHASVISLLLIMVGIYATLAWTFFFQTATPNIWLAVLGGLFMGAFIVSLDRALIASLASGKANGILLLFRLSLALLLGVFLSQPMILKLYEPEIQREAQILKDQKEFERKAELEKLYAGAIQNEKSKLTKLENQLTTKEQTLRKSEEDFKKEMDGSGGTGKWGYSVVAKQKEKIFNNHLKEYTDLKATTPLRIQKSQAKLDSIYNTIDSEMAIYSSENQHFGTLIQVAALGAVLDKDETGALKQRYYLLSIILILIELSALIAKLLFRMDSYKQKMMLQTEQELANLRVEKDIAMSRLEKFREIALERDLKTQ